jgi:hypothetical protein
VSFDRSSLNSEPRRFIAVSVRPPSYESPLKQFCGSALDPDPAFHLGANPNPDPFPGSQTNPDPDPGQTLLKVKKFNFYMKNILKVPVGNRSKTYSTVSKNSTANEEPVRIHYKSLVPIYVLPEMKLCSLLISKTDYNVLSPNSYTYISVRNLYFSRNCLSFLLQQNIWTDPGNQSSGSGSISQMYGSGSFYHQAKTVKKP